MNEKATDILLKSSVLVAFIGFLNALYLTYSEISGNFYCPLEGGAFQCETVNSSQYAKLLGVHVSVWGAIFYLIVIIMLFLAIFKKSEYWLSFYLPVAGIWGVGFSIYLTMIEAFVIGFFCEFCILSAIFTVVLLILIIVAKKLMFDSLFTKLDFWNLIKKE